MRRFVFIVRFELFVFFKFAGGSGPGIVISDRCIGLDGDAHFARFARSFLEFELSWVDVNTVLFTGLVDLFARYTVFFHVFDVWFNFDRPDLVFENIACSAFSNSPAGGFAFFSDFLGARFAPIVGVYNPGALSEKSAIFLDSLAAVAYDAGPGKFLALERRILDNNPSAE